MKKIISIILLVSVTGFSYAKIQKHDPEAIAERVKPVGQVAISGEAAPVAAVAEATAEVSAGPRSGEAIYNQACVACHSTGLLGAPKPGDQDAWLAQAQKSLGNDGLSNLVSEGVVDEAVLTRFIETSNSGIGAMPIMGTCMDCTDEEMQAAIEYMILTQ